VRRSHATCIVSLLLFACSRDEPPRKPTSDFRYTPPASERVQVEPGVAYTDVAAAAGIDFEHVTGAYGEKYLPETMGSGVGMLDYDGDGDLDLLFVQSREWPGRETKPRTPRLYRNEGGWRFTDVTADAGLSFQVYGMGCSIADYDADGDPDVYLTCLGRNVLLRNEGGRFARVADGPDGGTWTDKDGKTHPSWSSASAWFDADGDGDLDLLVANYVRWTPETDVYTQVVEGVKAYTRPQLYEGDGVRLYVQEGGRFRDATEGSGFDDTKVKGKSLGICLDDFDGDGATDVFVANDTVQNFLFLRRDDGTYEERAVPAAVAYDDNGVARAGMGTDSVDYRNDGRPSIAIANFSEEPVSLYTVARQAGGGPIFEDDAERTRIGTPTLLPLTFALLMVDADLDGWCDLVLANGHLDPSYAKLKPELQYEQAPQLFKNVGGERFADVSLDAGAPFQRRIVGRGLAAGDLDADGDLDLVLTANGGKPMVLRCDLRTKNRALRVRLRQPGPNRDALGAVVRVKAGGITQRRVVRTGGSYLSQGEFALTFGLGARERADEVLVRWPDGEEQSFGPLAARPEPHVLERAR